jgi:hypothetical protein
MPSGWLSVGESADFVVALLTGAEAAEGEAVLRDVHDGAAAGCRAVEDLASVGAVVAEVGERERPLSCVDVVEASSMPRYPKIGRMGPKACSWAKSCRR